VGRFLCLGDRIRAESSLEARDSAERASISQPIQPGAPHSPPHGFKRQQDPLWMRSGRWALGGQQLCPEQGDRSTLNTLLQLGERTRNVLPTAPTASSSMESPPEAGLTSRSDDGVRWSAERSAEREPTRRGSASSTAAAKAPGANFVVEVDHTVRSRSSSPCLGQRGAVTVSVPRNADLPPELDRRHGPTARYEPGERVPDQYQPEIHCSVPSSFRDPARHVEAGLSPRTLPEEGSPAAGHAPEASQAPPTQPFSEVDGLQKALEAPGGLAAFRGPTSSAIAGHGRQSCHALQHFPSDATMTAPSHRISSASSARGVESMLVSSEPEGETARAPPFHGHPYGMIPPPPVSGAGFMPHFSPTYGMSPHFFHAPGQELPMGALGWEATAYSVGDTVWVMPVGMMGWAPLPPGWVPPPHVVHEGWQQPRLPSPRVSRPPLSAFVGHLPAIPAEESTVVERARSIHQDPLGWEEALSFMTAMNAEFGPLRVTSTKVRTEVAVTSTHRDAEADDSASVAASVRYQSSRTRWSWPQWSLRVLAYFAAAMVHHQGTDWDRIGGVLASIVRGNIPALSRDQFGTHIVQGMLGVIPLLDTLPAHHLGEVTELALKELVPEVRSLQEDMAGNFVAKAMARLPSPFNTGIFDCIASDFVSWATGYFSCRSVQALFQSCSPAQMAALSRLVGDHCHEISEERFGSYVLEKVVLLACDVLASDAPSSSSMTKDVAQACIDRIAANMPPVSSEFVSCKAGSTMLESLLAWASAGPSLALQESLLEHLSTAATARCGNYVVQQLLLRGAPHVREKALAILSEMREELESTEYGSYVIRTLGHIAPTSRDP
jgi:hypothetical protein